MVKCKNCGHEVYRNLILGTSTNIETGEKKFHWMHSRHNNITDKFGTTCSTCGCNKPQPTQITKKEK